MSSLYKRKDSRFYWWEAITNEGKRLQLSTKTTRRDLAKQRAAEWDEMVWKGDLSFHPKNPSSKRDVEGYIKDYLKFISTRKTKKTVVTTTSVLNKFNDYISSKRIERMDAITVKVLDEYIDWMDCSAKTKKNYFGMVSLMLKQAIKEGVITNNPAKYATLPRVEKNPNKHRFLERIDLELIFSHAGPWYEYYQFLYHTGLRPNDVASLRYGYIDMTRKAITCMIHKTRKLHELPIADHLIEMIPDGVKDDEPIFPQIFPLNVGEQNDRLANPRKYMQSILRLNDRPSATLYSFRRTYNNLLRDLDLPIEDRQILMTHASSETTKIYTNPNLEKAREYVNRIPVYGKGPICKT